MFFPAPNPCRRTRCFPLCLLVPGDNPYEPKAKCACPDGSDFLNPSTGTNCRVREYFYHICNKKSLEWMDLKETIFFCDLRKSKEIRPTDFSFISLSYGKKFIISLSHPIRFAINVQKYKLKFPVNIY